MNPLTAAPEKRYIPLSLLRFRTLLVGVFDQDGRVLESNAGFRMLCAEEESASDWNCSEYLINPSWDQLHLSTPSDDSEKPIYQGILTLRFPEENYQSVTAMIFRQEGLYYLVAEYNVEELGLLNTSVAALNDELMRMQRELVRTNHKLEEQRELFRMASITDVLTGLYNRRFFIESLTEEIERSDRYGKNLSLILCDIGHFKDVNDTYGHDQGDQVLRNFSELINESLRSFDIAARFGGEEFILLLPETTIEQAVITAERLRKQFEQQNITSPPTTITASFGVAEYIKEETEVEIIKRADLALYQAKNTGRNRVAKATD
ncbi:MAG: GGDEF domain-containing protein [Sedimenticola sp.]|nr:GGDEF domain-containing protein [Sedimenticola sp.]